MSGAVLDTLWVWLDDPVFGPLQRLGTLQRGGRGTVRFSYDAGWLKSGRAFELDPQLRLDAGPQFARGANFGVFLDSCPDRWGQVLLRRRESLAAREAGRRVRELDAWDFLQGVQDCTRMGALRFSAPDSGRFLADEALSAPPMAKLAELQALATELSRSGIDDLPELRRWLAVLLAPGSSLGGARPKANLQGDDGLWIAKFPAAQDTHDVALWEMLLHQLAEAAGVSLAPAKLWRAGGGYHSFLTRRFDRQGASRRLFCSAMTLLEKADGEEASYLELAEFLASHGDPAALEQGLAQLFRRLLFNLAAGNRDDHLRNHGFLRSAAGWVLAPAYDLNPSFDKADHALSLDGAQTRPTVQQALATAPYYRLLKAQAERIVGEVLAAVATWQAKGKALGLSRAELMRGEGHFVVG
jgi:serine/threonine-protein kinase HipA